MMNYQEFQEILKITNSKALEKMRLTVILSITLVFGLFLQSSVFADDSDFSNSESKNAKDNTLKLSASSLPILSTTPPEKVDYVEPELKKEEFKKVEEKEKKGNILNQIVEVPVLSPDIFPIKNLNVEDIKVNASSAIVLSEDGRILYEKNIEEKLPIASLTKIVAAMVILENVDMNDIVTVTKDAIKTEGISGRFIEGEKIKAKDLLKIMLVISSNDAAVAFYEHMKLSGLDLVELMNKKVSSLGLLNTKFSNVVGLDDENNYSTAHDYAKIVLSSLDNDILWSILSIKDELLSSGDLGGKDRRLISSNKLMFKNIKGLLGGKTGYTENAGGCLMTAFKLSAVNNRDDVVVVSVILGASDTTTRFEEMQKIINWTKKAYIF